MTPSEFENVFLAAVKRYYPGLYSWLRKGETAAGWWDSLGYNDAADAVEAVTLIHKGSLGRIREPQSREDYVRCINALCYAIRADRQTGRAVNTTGPQLIDGEWRYRCPACEDTGTVEVHGHASVKRLIEGAKWGDRGTLYAASAACTCSAGDKFTKWNQNPLPRYNAATMVLCPAGIKRGTYPEGLQSFVESHTPKPGLHNEWGAIPEATA